MSPVQFLCFSLLLVILFSFTNASITRTSSYSPPKCYKPAPFAQYIPPAKPTSDIYQHLVGQNSARAVGGLPPLARDNKLAAYAQWWAHQRRGDCSLVHSNGPCGENIFWASSSTFYLLLLANLGLWRKGGMITTQIHGLMGKIVASYPNCLEEFKDDCCAKAICYGGQGVCITCNHDPAGNYIGERPY